MGYGGTPQGPQVGGRAEGSLHAESRLDEEDACDVLANLTLTDLVGRLVSEKTGEWMHVFKPLIGGTVVYVKVVLRADCVVISFHEEEESDEDE